MARVRRVPPPRRQFERYHRARVFRISRNILARRSRPSRTRANTSENVHKLTNLPVDILHQIFDKLDTPSLITLGLTCKTLGSLITSSPYTATQTVCFTDKPTFIARPVFIAHIQGPIAPVIQYTPTLSDRRIFMLQIQPFMKRGYRLCWMCLHYTPIKTRHGPWHYTTQVNTLGDNALPIDFLVRRPLTKVWAHAKCMERCDIDGGGRGFGRACLVKTGAAGGRDTYVSSMVSRRGRIPDRTNPDYWVHE